MLEFDPEKRATVDEILDSDWMIGINSGNRINSLILSKSQKQFNI